MRSVFAVSLIVTILFSGSYFYYEAQAICAVPISYRIGTLDERFNLSFEEARLAVADAEAAWEDATERNLFTYDETADFAINFIFDDRQALADAQITFKDRLDATEGLTDAMRATYEELVARYERKSAEYQDQVEQYDERLAEYNAIVNRYNADGGAPSDAFAALEAEQEWLERERRSINRAAAELNDLVDEINQVGERSNQLVTTYNRTVETFNQTFGTSREFTQGDYQGDQINIYTFTSPEELRLVLVHELGHALSLDHTDAETAVMHYLLGEQSSYQPTADDVTLFQSICGASTMERIRQQLIEVVAELQRRLGGRN